MRSGKWVMGSGKILSVMNYLLDMVKYSPVWLAFILLGVLLLSCFGKKIVMTDANLKSLKQEVAKCANAEDITDLVGVIVRPGKTVQCGKYQASGCYQDGIIYLPQETSVNAIKHEFVHFFCDKKYKQGNDQFHFCKDTTTGENMYLKCSGIELLEGGDS